MENNNFLKKDNFELINGIFRSFNKGVLSLFEDKIIWKGREEKIFFIHEINSISVGNWNGHHVLDLFGKNQERTRFYPYELISMFTVSDKSFLLIESWINIVEKIKFSNILDKTQESTTPLDFLKMRLAKGDITIEEFEKLKSAILN